MGKNLVSEIYQYLLAKNARIVLKSGNLKIGCFYSLVNLNHEVLNFYVFNNSLEEYINDRSV